MFSIDSTARLRSSKSDVLSLWRSSCSPFRFLFFPVWDRGDGGIMEAGGVDGVNADGKLGRGEAVEVASTKASGEGMEGWREALGDEEVDG